MSVTTLNAIRATATSAYQDTVPLATMDNITEVGKAVLESPSTIQNEFLAALINKVGLQLFNDRQFTNPLIGLQKGKLEYGQTIEDIFVEMAQAKNYITGTREGESVPDQFEVNKAIAETGYYSKIFGKQYFKTVHRDDLKRAFFNEGGVNRLVSSIMTAMQNGQNFDDYRMTIALIARQIEQCLEDAETKWNGDIHLITDYHATVAPLEVGEDPLTPDEALASKAFLTYMANQIKKYSQRLTSPRTDFNPAGVTSWAPKGEQRLMMIEDIQSDLDTNLLAWAYNSGKLEIGSVDLINAWYSIGNPESGSVSPEDIVVKGELGATGPVVAVLYHPNMVKIYNKTTVSSTSENARGLYYNVFNTYEDYFACSPFENFVAFFLD